MSQERTPYAVTVTQRADEPAAVPTPSHHGNGATAVLTPPPPATGPALRMPRREMWVELPQDAYPGFEVRLWVNYPTKERESIKSGDVDRALTALQHVVLATRVRNGTAVVFEGWPDEDGNPLPPPTERAFWDAIPDELAATLISLLVVESERLPKSILGRRGG